MDLYDNIGIIILAAGKGTRMKSGLAKVLHDVAGKSMISRVVDCANKIVSKTIYVVVGHQAQKVKDEVSSFFNVQFSVQQKLLGTGDAVKSALPLIDSKIKDILVLCGDLPLIQPKTLELLINGHRLNRATVTVLATDVDDPTGYGRLLLDAQGELLAIREEADANDVEKKINKINTGIYLFNSRFLQSAITELRPDNRQEEYYLTDVISIAKNSGHKISVVTMDDPDQVMGVNTLEQLRMAEYLIQQGSK